MIINPFQFGQSYDPDALAYFEASAADGGITGTTGGLTEDQCKAAFNNLVVTCKSVSAWTSAKLLLASYGYRKMATGVSKWYEAKGANAVQATVAEQFQFLDVDAAFNGLPSMLGDGVDDGMYGPLALTGTQATSISIFRVMTPNVNGRLIGMATTAGFDIDPTGIAYAINTSGANGGSYQLGFKGVHTGNWGTPGQVQSVTLNGTTLSSRINGADEQTAACTSSLVGERYFLATDPTGGHLNVKQVFHGLWEAALTPTQINAICTLLCGQAGITWTPIP